MGPIARGSEGPTAPESTVSRLTDCANEGAHRLTGDTVFGISVDVEVTESGSVRAAKVRESMLPDGGMEACMVSALEAMSVPLSVMARLTSPSISSESRGYMGDVTILGGAVNLLPIVIVAAGVTILVAITVHAADDLVEAIKRRRKVEKMCAQLRDQCLSSPWQPEWNRETFGDKKDCLACFFNCKRHNEWPEDKCPRSN